MATPASGVAGVVAAEPLELATLHVFISRALQKVLREAPKKHTQLRQACTEVIGAQRRAPATLCARMHADACRPSRAQTS